MNIVLKKPILVAGVSLSFLLWLGQSLTHHLGEIGNLTFLVVIFFGGFSLILSKTKKKANVAASAFANITISDFQEKITKLDTLIDTLVEEAKSSDKLEYSQQNYHLFKQNLTQISKIIQRPDLHIGILNKRNNSLNLSQLLQNKFPKIKISAIPQSFTNYELEDNQKSQILLNYDLVFLIVQGDLTDSEKKLIQEIKNNQQRVLILFDDIEFSLQEEKELIWQNIKNSLQGIIPEEEVIKISSQSQKVKVIKYQDNLNYQESEEIFPAKYEQLIDIYQNKLQQEKEKLIFFTAYRNAFNLETKIKQILNQIRKTKALVVIEKYQIIAATATFANPVSSLDLLATAAINTQMIVDLGKIYQQSLSISQAQEISIALGKLMMKLGIVEISSQAVTNILKSNAFTFVAGGVIQGISAAYLTKICGLSLVEYYQVVDLNKSQEINFNIVKKKIQLIFQQNKDNNILTKFVQNTAFLLKTT
jgi:uncharacterized protein (DUF697 family)